MPTILFKGYILQDEYRLIEHAQLAVSIRVGEVDGGFQSGNGYFTGLRHNLKPFHGFLDVGRGKSRCLEPN